MRPIKFRAWNVKERQMYDYRAAKFMTLDGCIVSSDDNHEPDFEEAEDYKLMQYAECTDANGQEIYDGDLVVSSWTSDPSLYQASVSGRWGLKWKNLANRNSTAFMRPEENVRVIGNVWENPDLIREKPAIAGGED
jgi:uncharacterized phage protein (TIGR01671 family)